MILEVLLKDLDRYTQNILAFTMGSSVSWT